MIVYWVKKIQHSLYFYGNIYFLNGNFLWVTSCFGCVGKFKITKLSLRFLISRFKVLLFFLTLLSEGEFLFQLFPYESSLCRESN